MTGPPPPFEPAAADLKAQSAAIQAAVSEYSSAKGTQHKTAALQKISDATQVLSRASTNPGLTMARFVFQPQANAVVRVAIGMGLFEAIPMNGTAHINEIAQKCNSEPDFVQRIARAVSSQNMLKEVGEETYGHNEISMMLCDDTAKATLAHMFDNVGVTMFYLNEYFKKHGYKTPTDIKNTPTVFARGLENVGYFEWLTQNPEIYTIFNKAMAFYSMTGVDGITSTYPWDTLKPGPNGVSVIDVGGGKGHILKELIAAHPSLSGHAVLQDLGNVLEDGSLVTPDAVKSVPYDFLTETQPVIGAAAYYFRHVLCDWPEWTCIDILKRQIPAMKGQNSKLLITDLVLPNVGADHQKTGRDINMLQVSGVERSEKQWHAMLDKAGFRIVEIYSKDDPNNSVIEAALKDE